MIRALLIILASFLILIVSGCANTVSTPTVQQHYLVVSANLQGNVDTTRFRYFVFVKYGASSTMFPDLSSPNQNARILSIASGSTIGIEGANTGVGGQGPLSSNFLYDEYYEWSQFGATWATFPTAVSGPNSTGFRVVRSPTNIQFSIPLNTASSPIGINIVTTGYNTNNANPAPWDCQVLDYVVSYVGITNQLGVYIPLQTNPPVTQIVPIASDADIVSWSASII